MNRAPPVARVEATDGPGSTATPSRTMIPNPFTRSLSARLLVLTITFVMLAEVLIFAPSIARFRLDYLRERLAAGHLAALSIEAAPDAMVTRELETKLLDHVGAFAVDLELPSARIYMLASQAQPTIDAAFDLRGVTAPDLIVEAFATLARGRDRVIRVTGVSPKDPAAHVTVVLDERPMRDAMIGFGQRILLLSIVISLITAGLVYVSLHWTMVRPIRRITESMVAFRRDPEAPEAGMVPGGRRDEIGIAQRELATMQETLRAALRQKERLAALGTAVTKINHDLRGILSTAALVSERLTTSDDPEVRRVTPRLLDAIDRAVALCGQTLSYTRDGVVPPHRSDIDLATLVDAVGRDVTVTDHRTGDKRQRHWMNAVPAGTRTMADREQLTRVLVNLGSNAYQAGAETVTVRAGAADGRLTVHVEDDGPGLPPRARDNLFQPFTGSARPGGTGLGLAISREIMRAHGGDLRLVRSTAQGTAFVLELPATGMSR